MPKHYEITVQKGQNVFDLAVQEYGTPDAVFLLIDDNPDLIPNINTNLYPGDRVKIRKVEQNIDDQEVMDFFRRNKLRVRTGDDHCEGIGCWRIENDFVVS